MTKPRMGQIAHVCVEKKNRCAESLTLPCSRASPKPTDRRRSRNKVCTASRGWSRLPRRRRSEGKRHAEGTDAGIAPKNRDTSAIDSAGGNVLSSLEDDFPQTCQILQVPSYLPQDFRCSVPPESRCVNDEELQNPSHVPATMLEDGGKSRLPLDVIPLGTKSGYAVVPQCRCSPPLPLLHPLPLLQPTPLLVLHLYRPASCFPGIVGNCEYVWVCGVVENFTHRWMVRLLKRIQSVVDHGKGRRT